MDAAVRAGGERTVRASSAWLSPIAEIVGSMPATALFPVIVVFVIQVTGGMNLASILLILTGMQWYLLFNLLAGVSQMPEDLKEAARAFGSAAGATWRKLDVPALVPSLDHRQHHGVGRRMERADPVRVLRLPRAYLQGARASARCSTPRPTKPATA